MGFLDLKESVLAVKTTVGGQSAWHDEQGVGKAVDTELGLATHVFFRVLLEVLAAGDLKCASARNNCLILDGVDDCTKTVTDCLLDLGDGVVVWTLDQNSAREWIVNTFDERVLIVTKRLLVD